MSARDPLLSPIPLTELRPTQLTVGLREVAEKQREWRARSGEDGAAFLGRHMIPVISGPKARPYVIDHHHLTRALMAEGVESILVNVLADLSHLKKSEFWTYCDNRGWCHPYDTRGKRVRFSEIPASLMEMSDDPFRSLAGAARRAGGFAKDITPFSEFIWSDFLRRRIDRELVGADFEGALDQALKLARSSKAQHLPGWCGPTT